MVVKVSAVDDIYVWLILGGPLQWQECSRWTLFISSREQQ